VLLEGSAVSAAPDSPRSRRSLLTTAAAAAGGALAASALGRIPAASAANADPVKVGGLHMGTAVTEVRNTAATSNAVALKGFVTTTGPGGSTAGVWGQSAAQGGSGVFGIVTHAGAGNKGVYGRSTAGTGVLGEATATTGVSYGVRGSTASSSGVGVAGIASAGSGSTTGVSGSSASPGGRGVQGQNSAAGGTGVLGVANNGSDAKGVWGRSASGYGVYGETTASGLVAGVLGVANAAPNGWGVYGGGYTGVYGSGAVNGVHGVTNDGYGVHGESFSSAGVFGFGRTGVRGEGVQGQGVYGSSNGIGVLGEGTATGAVGIYGTGNWTTTRNAGYFEGDVTVSGILYTPNALLQLDHPEAPARRWYRQALVGSFEQVSVIGGNAVTGANGRVSVKVASLFARHHTDIRYQVTPIGEYQQVYIAAKLDGGGRFTIAADRPGLEVSWQLTGVRTDPAAQAQPLHVVARKPRRYQGRYLQPDLFGESRKQSLIPLDRARRHRRQQAPPIRPRRGRTPADR
jgi:hypothetical protein